MPSGTVPCPVAARRSARLAERNNNEDRALTNTIVDRSSEVYQTPGRAEYRGFAADDCQLGNRSFVR